MRDEILKVLSWLFWKIHPGFIQPELATPKVKTSCLSCGNQDTFFRILSDKTGLFYLCPECCDQIKVDYCFGGCNTLVLSGSGTNEKRFCQKCNTSRIINDSRQAAEDDSAPINRFAHWFKRLPPPTALKVSRAIASLDPNLTEWEFEKNLRKIKKAFSRKGGEK